MSDSTCPQPDDVRSALEATCDALMTLESVRATTDDCSWDEERHLIEAIGLLRQTIRELRLARGDQESVVARGFVVGDASALADGR